jgi:glycosyltransferase involved in cell wall biosynthesis
MNRPPEADTPLAARLKALRTAAPAFVARQQKTLSQGRYGWRHPRRVTFVFGCQRSGTKMVMRILENSPSTRIYHENHTTAFRDFQLRSDAVLRSLVALNPAPCQIFKPICDSQDAPSILRRFPNAGGVWVYRHHADVANSAAEKWGAHQRDVVTAVVTGEVEGWGWRTAGVPPDAVAALRSVWRPDLTPSEGALLFWYLRNQFFFSLDLDRHPRMLLVRYEDLVRDPLAAFPPLFAHVGAPFDPAFVARVRSDSVGRREPPPASADIHALCAELQDRLDRAAAARRAPLPSPVLQVINTLGVGGAERYVVTVSNWLAERGVDVRVASSAGGELQASLRPDVRHHAVDLRRVRADLPVAAARLAPLLAARPAVVIAHSLVTTWVARLADPLRQTPIVNVAHGWPADRYTRVAPLLRLAADRVVAVSPDVRDHLVKAGFPADRIEVVENGVDLRGLEPRTGKERAAIRASVGATDDDLLVLSVGRLTDQKAQHHVAAIAARLRDTTPRARFAIVGTGPREAELRAAIDAAGVGDRVVLAGLRHDVPALLGSADLYLSTSDWEGMSLTIIEAMASGLATVATRTEGSSQLLADGCGDLVPVGDVDAMAAAVGALLADPARRARMGAVARARAFAHHGHDRMMHELVAAVGRAIAAP